MEKTFEEKLQELEKINQNLSQGDLPLERALKEFEAGITLSKECQKTLEAAEKRVNILTEKDNIWEETDYSNQIQEEKQNPPTSEIQDKENPNSSDSDDLPF